MLRHWRIIASARCMQSARICIQQTNITKVCQNDSRYLTLTNHDLCDTITMQSCANSNNALVAYMHWTALCHGWTGCSTPWLCRLHLILSVMISAKVTSAKKVCMTMTSAGQVGTADHTNVECDCKTCVQYWTCAKSAWQLYLQVDVLLWEMCTQLTQLHQGPEKPKALL